MFNRILVPLDGSRLSLKALPYAADIAMRFGAEVVLVRVVTPTPISSYSVGENVGISGAGPDPRTMEFVTQQAEILDKENMAQANRYLSRHARHLSNSGVKATKQALIGDVAKSVLDYSKKRKVDLIVMTTRGRGGLKRAVFGSVADQLVRAVGAPVLVIRP